MAIKFSDLEGKQMAFAQNSWFITSQTALFNQREPEILIQHILSSGETKK